MNYWQIIEELISLNGITIDRKKGTGHPRFTSVIYPIDYGFINGTKAMDGGGIDIFIGEEKEKIIKGVICTVDKLKNDAEIKVAYGCSAPEIEIILDFLNKSDFMKAIWVPRLE